MQKWMKLSFMIYILLLIKFIIFKYPYEQIVEISSDWKAEVIFVGLGSANFMPFKTIRMYIKYADRLNSFENLAGNIIAFVPFGMMLPLINTRTSIWKYVFANALVFVIGIELFQLVSAFGVFDVDDIILNCFGVILGYVIYIKSRSMFPVFDKKIRIEEEKYGTNFEEN